MENTTFENETFQLTSGLQRLPKSVTLSGYLFSLCFNLLSAMAIMLPPNKDLVTPTYYTLFSLHIVYIVHCCVKLFEHYKRPFFLIGWLHFGLWFPQIHMSGQIAITRGMAVMVPSWYRDMVDQEKWKPKLMLTTIGPYAFSAFLGTSLYTLYPFGFNSRQFWGVICGSLVYLMFPPTCFVIAMWKLRGGNLLNAANARRLAVISFVDWAVQIGLLGVVGCTPMLQGYPVYAQIVGGISMLQTCPTAAVYAALSPAIRHGWEYILFGSKFEANKNRLFSISAGVNPYGKAKSGQSDLAPY